MAYTADDLITSAKRRAAIPTASATWDSTAFLAVADEEVLTYCVPIVQRVREDYYLQQDEYSPLQNSSGNIQYFRIPDRALGGTSRDVSVYDSNQNPIDIPRIMVDDLAMASWGYFALGANVGYINRTALTSPSKLIITYYLRPSALTLQANVAKVASFDANAKTVTLATTPAGYAGNTSWDIIRGTPNFEMLTFDEPGTLAAGVITFTATLPTDLAVGDWVALPGVTPVPQIPAEMHPLLAQRLAVKFLEAQGESEEFQRAAAVAARMEVDVTNLLTPRFAGEPRKLIPRDNIWRRWRR